MKTLSKRMNQICLAAIPMVVSVLYFAFVLLSTDFEPALALSPVGGKE